MSAKPWKIFDEVDIKTDDGKERRAIIIDAVGFFRYRVRFVDDNSVDVVHISKMLRPED